MVRILVVEDDPHNRLLMKRYLSACGFDVFECETGQEALEFVKDVCPQLVLTDEQMPGMSGTELISRLRERGIDVPVVLVSAHFTCMTTADITSKTGANVALKKPVIFSRLFRELQNLLLTEPPVLI